MVFLVNRIVSDWRCAIVDKVPPKLYKLANEVERLVVKAYPDVPETMYQKLYLECFTEALRDPELQCELCKAHTTTDRDALGEASRIEAVLHD